MGIFPSWGKSIAPPDYLEAMKKREHERQMVNATQQASDDDIALRNLLFWSGIPSAFSTNSDSSSLDDSSSSFSDSSSSSSDSSSSSGGTD